MGRKPKGGSEVSYSYFAQWL